jgi:carbonic anhydrase
VNDDGFASLLDGNERYARDLADGQSWGDASTTGLLIACSGDAPDPVAPWPLDSAARTATVASVGNRAAGDDAGPTGLRPDVIRLGRRAEAVVVVGHTDCRPLGDAYDRQLSAGATPSQGGGRATVLAPLDDVVEAAFAAGIVEPTTARETALARLVECNVGRQVAALRDGLPGTTVAGYVRDRAGAYDAFAGKRYLVALDDDRDPAAIRGRLPDGAAVRVGTVLGCG